MITIKELQANAIIIHSRPKVYIFLVELNDNTIHTVFGTGLKKARKIWSKIKSQDSNNMTLDWIRDLRDPDT